MRRGDQPDVDSGLLYGRELMMEDRGDGAGGYGCGRQWRGGALVTAPRL